MLLDILLLFILILIFTASGKRVFKLTGMEFSSFAEEMVFSFGLGAGIIALLTLGIGLLCGLKRWIFYILISGLLGVLIFDVKDILIGTIRWIRAKRHRLPSFETALLVIFGLYFLLTFFCALAPSTEWDSLVHHLAVPKAYVQNGRIFNMSPAHGWFVKESNYPSNMEMLFMLGMLLKSDTLATLIAWSVAIVLTLSVYSLSRQFFSARASLISMGILLSGSIVVLHATCNTVDTGVSLFALLALYAAFKSADSGDYRFLLFSGVYAGFCAGTKYTGLPVIPVLGSITILLVVLERREPLAGVKYMCLFGLVALAVASPWYIKNYVYTRNPVYPFFSKMLGGKNVLPGDAGYALSTPWRGAEDYSTWYNLLLGYIRFPWDLTMMRGVFGKMSSIGPLYLIFIPCLLFIKNIHRKVKYTLFYGLCGLTIVFALAQRTRYLFPFVPPLAVVASYSLFRISERDEFIKRVSLIILVAAILLNMILVLQLTVVTGPVILGLESRRDYLSSNLRNYEAILYINENLPDSARILSSDPTIYYCNIPCVYDEAVMDYKAFQDDEMKLLEELKRLHISHILADPVSGMLRSKPSISSLYKKLVMQGKLREVFVRDYIRIYELATD
jgi:hypothetical protein